MMQQVDTFWLSKNPLMRAIRRQISIYPSIYIPLRRMRMSETVVHGGTDLLIEGFPRSGNTWTEALLREASGDRLDLAHHAHAAAHVKRALALGVPSMILFRDPDDAVTSLLALNENQLDARGAFLEYERFYKTVLPLRGRPMVRFYSLEDVTTRPTDVVKDVAEHFDMDLSPDELDSAPGQARVFARMDEKALRLKRRRTEHSKSRPITFDMVETEQRGEARASLQEGKSAQARARAYAVYAQLRSDLPANEGAAGDE